MVIWVGSAYISVLHSDHSYPIIKTFLYTQFRNAQELTYWFDQDNNNVYPMKWPLQSPESTKLNICGRFGNDMSDKIPVGEKSSGKWSPLVY